MNIQTPATRRNDPATSYQAEQRMNITKKRVTHQRIISDFVESHPGFTAAEIGEKTGLGQHECSRRLPEIEGLTVSRGDARKCRVNRTNMATWYPV